MIILVAVGGVSWEAVQRLTDPHSVLFAKGRDRDLDVRAAFLQLVAADAAVSAGAV
jgi:Co/Zn/Cd efflux system component